MHSMLYTKLYVSKRAHVSRAQSQFRVSSWMYRISKCTHIYTGIFCSYLNRYGAFVPKNDDAAGALPRALLYLRCRLIPCS